MAADHVHCRAHTHHEEPPCWTASPLRDFRLWNRLKYEPWVRRACSDDVKPFWQQPEENLLMYATETSADVRQSTVALMLDVHDEISTILHDQQLNQRLWTTWNRATSTQRQSWCLQLWREEQEKAEEIHETISRPEAPELTVAWAAEASNLGTLLDSLPFDRRKWLYRHVPEPTWDRLHNWESALSTPPSRYVRSFTETGKIIRAHYLAKFCFSLMCLVLDRPRPSDNGQAVKPSVKLCRDDLSLFQHAGSDALHQAQEEAAEHSVARCMYCRYTGCNCPDGRLTRCSACKKVGRSVYYCSEECSKADWPRHRLGCGKTLTEYESAVTAAPHSPTPQAASLTAQVENADWLDLRPRTVWGMGSDDQDDISDQAVYDEGEETPSVQPGEVPFRFDLPLFVRPYLATLQAFRAIYSALVNKDAQELDAGILAYFVQLACGLRGSPWVETSDSYVQRFASLFDLDVAGVKFGASIVAGRIERSEELEGVDPLIISALKQMKSGKPDLSFPDERLLPTALPLLNRLLLHPDTFFAFPSFIDVDSPPSPPSRAYEYIFLPATTTSALLPNPNRTVATLRALAFRVVFSAGTDLGAIGRLVLVVWVKLGVDDASIEHAEEEYEPSFAESKRRDRRHVAEDLEGMMGMEGGAVENAVSAAVAELAEGGARVTSLEEKEELEDVRAAVELLREEYFAWLAEDSDDEEEERVGRKGGGRRRRKKKGGKKKKGRGRGRR